MGGSRGRLNMKLTKQDIVLNDTKNYNNIIKDNVNVWKLNISWLKIYGKA